MKASTACLLGCLGALGASLMGLFYPQIHTGPLVIVSAICFVGQAICTAIEDKAP